MGLPVVVAKPWAPFILTLLTIRGTMKAYPVSSESFTRPGRDLLEYVYPPEFNLESIIDIGDEEMQRAAIAAGALHVSQNIYFLKKGKEIASQIGTLIGKTKEEISEKQKNVQEVCKRREVKLDEILKDPWVNKYLAGEIDDDALYSNSVSLKSVTSQLPEATMGFGKILTKDLHDIMEVARFTVSKETLIENLERVKKHINPEEEYKLSYSDLVQYGF